uniref:Pro-FMRFamide-related neuropeptide VF n=1 Tax=Monodelphis domestica TaxID=13616 RepID=F6TB25_MONDO
MEIISSKRFVILTLATSILLASESVCADESVMSNLCNWEHYNEYLKPRDHPKEKKQKSLPLEEHQHWGSNTIYKVRNLKLNKIPQLMPHPPLRFGRSFEEERSIESVANLPFRFGRNLDGGISRRIPNLPQRFGRAAVKGMMESTNNSPQKFKGSPFVEKTSYPMASQHLELQAADERKSRTLNFYKKAHDGEMNQEEREVWSEAPDPKVM